MKRAAAFVVMCLLVGAGTALAQEKAEVQESRTGVEAEREAVIEKNLELTAAEKKQFWPVYKKYRAEMKKVEDQRLGLIQSFAREYRELTDAKAESFLRNYFKFRQAKVDLQSRYIDTFKQVLPAKKVARYYQVENLLDTKVDYDLTRAIPLMK